MVFTEFGFETSGLFNLIKVDERAVDEPMRILDPTRVEHILKLLPVVLDS